MDQSRIRELTGLLGESLQFVEVRGKRTDPIDIAEYRDHLQRVREKFDPDHRSDTSSWSLHIEQPHLKQESLDFIRSELAEYLLQDRFQSAAVILSESRPNSAPVSIILRNLVRRPIVDGAATAAQAFADCITGTSCSYSEYYAVAGLIVNKEIEVFDGAWLIPLSSSADRLPPYLPTDFSSVFIRRPGEMDYGRPWARTLIRIDHKVSPIFHKPPETYDSDAVPNSPFKDTLMGEDPPNLDIRVLFHALSLACKCRIQPVVWWREFPEPYEIFDLRPLIGPTSVTLYPQDVYQPVASPEAEKYGADVRKLYNGFAPLQPDARTALQIPIGRLITLLGQRDDTDRMIDLGIAFESLYLGGSDSRSQIRLQFAKRASQYLGKNKAERKRLFGTFKKIYTKRSDAVHTGAFMKEADHDERSEFIEQAQSLCLQSIEAVIEHGKLPNWNDL